MRLKFCLAALAATTAFASPAFAQVVATDTATAEARGLVLLPLTLTKVDDLDFGTVVASAVAGNVVIDPDTGARTGSAGVTLVASAPGQRAVFAGAGTSTQVVNLTLTPPVGMVLNSGPNSLVINSLSLDSVAAPTGSVTINASGAFTVGVGGDFAIGGNQPNGLYAADFDLTADYL